MKAKILSRLRQDPERVVSGESLSAELGISRVSVWKHVRRLQEAGYRIAAGPSGYRLLAGPDIPYPWEFPPWEDRFHYFGELDSTMEKARDLARKGCPELTVVAAGRQLKGRGRMDRTWLSDAGGLYFTVVVRPVLPPQWVTRTAFAASVAMCRTLRDDLGVPAELKWPNDTLVAGKKLSGMLAEMEAESDRVAYVNIGIGVNVNNDPVDAGPGATSVCRILGRPASRVALLAGFLGRFRQMLDPGRLESVIGQWRQYACTLNRPVRIVTPSAVHEGLAVDVDDDGALVIRSPDGTLRRVVHGDCFHR